MIQFKLFLIIYTMLCLLSCGLEPQERTSKVKRDTEADATKSSDSSDNSENTNSKNSQTNQSSNQVESDDTQDSTDQANPSNAKDEESDDNQADVADNSNQAALGLQLYDMACGGACHGVDGLADDKKVSKSSDPAKLISGFEKKANQHAGINIDEEGLTAIAAAVSALP